LALNILNKLFYRFPQVLDTITEIVLTAMKEQREKTRKIVEQLIEAEQNYLYTCDLDYLTNRGAFFPKTDPKEPKNTVSDPNKIFIQELRNRIDSYFMLVCRNVRDSVPKIIGTFLVRACQDDLQFALYDEINKDERFLHNLSEPESITMERNTLLQTLSTLQKAVKAIKKDPDLSRKLDIEKEPKEEDKNEKPREREKTTHNRTISDKESHGQRSNALAPPVQQPQARSVTPSNGRTVEPAQPQKQEPVFPPPKKEEKPQEPPKKSSGWGLFK